MHSQFYIGVPPNNLNKDKLRAIINDKHQKTNNFLKLSMYYMSVMKMTTWLNKEY